VPLPPKDPTALPSSRGAALTTLGERELIERIKQHLPPPPDWVKLGVGDDAAVLEPERGMLDVVTTDVMIEGIHFERTFMTMEDIGYKALAINLSDLAAMGARPRAIVLSLALPAHDILVSEVDELLAGIISLAKEHEVALIGGNIACSPGPLFVDITALGSVKRRAVLSRSGAKPGDGLYVTGTVGSASAGFQWLTKSNQDNAPNQNESITPCVARFKRPDPRVKVGMLMGRNRVPNAAIDLSDGLGDAIHSLTGHGPFGAIIDATSIPIHPGARTWFEQQGLDPVNAAIQGGEDYELLLAISPTPRSRVTLARRFAEKVTLTHIGTVTNEPDLILRQPDGDAPLPTGFRHF